MEDKKAFDELRFKQIDLQKQLVTANSQVPPRQLEGPPHLLVTDLEPPCWQLSLKDRQKRKSELTMSELAELPSDTKLYKTVGKSYVRAWVCGCARAGLAG